jgi:hypothetical protein
MRAFTHATHIRYLINQWVIEGRKGDLAAAVRVDLQTLAKSALPWCPRVVLRTRARLANLRGDSSEAIALFRKSLDEAYAGGHMDVGVYDRYALGVLVGGAEGEALRATAEAELRAQLPIDPAEAMRSHYPELFLNAAGHLRSP